MIDKEQQPPVIRFEHNPSAVAQPYAVTIRGGDEGGYVGVGDDPPEALLHAAAHWNRNTGRKPHLSAVCGDKGPELLPMCQLEEMTVEVNRDEVAMHAMQGILTAGRVAHPKDVAEWAYRAADALIAEGKKGAGE